MEPVLPVLPVFYGENTCSGTTKKGVNCTNKAFYSTVIEGNTVYRCGIHSHKDSREKLPNNPNKAKIIKENQKLVQNKIDEITKENKEIGKKGNIAVGKLLMVKQPTPLDGYVAVFPNYKDKSNRVGLNLPELSPMRLGQIDHKQPELPPATNLENFHQGNKLYDCEAFQGYPTTTGEFFKNQRIMYTDEEPYRHKQFAFMRENAETPKKKEKPICSIWILPDKSMKRIGYMETRQIYCEIYERMASQLPEYRKLVEMRDAGSNIQIFGFDGYDTSGLSAEECYNNADLPFGHELVLWTMLTCDPADYPWKKCKKYEF